MNFDTLLTRDKLAAALTEAGYPIAASTLAGLKCRGGGPPVKIFGRTPLYEWQTGLQWAKHRTTRMQRAA